MFYHRILNAILKKEFRCPHPSPLFDETTRPCKNIHSLRYKLRRIQEFWLRGVQLVHTVRANNLTLPHRYISLYPPGEGGHSPIWPRWVMYC